MRVTGCLIIMLCAASPGAVAQDLHADFLRGRELLARAVAYHGGPGAMAGMRGVRVTLDGEIRNPEQGYRAAEVGDPPVLPGAEAYRMRATVDLAGERAHIMQEQAIRGGLRLRFETFFAEGRAWSGATYAGTHSVGPATFAGALFPVRRWVPFFAVRAALGSLAAVTYVGASDLDPDAEVIAFSWDGFTRDRLHIRGRDGRVVALEATVVDRFRGSDLALFEYGDWEVSGAVPFPRRVILSRYWGPIAELHISGVEAVGEFAAQTFEPPSGSTAVPASPTTGNVVDNVWEISGLGGGIYRVQFVDLGDRVIVFEAPLGVAVGRQVLAAIRTSVGDKPVSHVVLSHFHSDHTGGLRPFVEAGATVVTTPQNVEVVRALARTPLPHMFVLADPDPPQQVPIVTVAAGAPLVLGGANDTVTVYNLGAFPHVESMLVAHVAPSGALLNGDLFSRISLFNETFEQFAGWLRETDLDIEWVLGTHHEPLPPDAIFDAAESRQGKLPNRP